MTQTYTQDIERLMARIDLLNAEHRILLRKTSGNRLLRGETAGRRMWQRLGDSNSTQLEFRIWSRLSIQEQQATRAKLGRLAK